MGFSSISIAIGLIFSPLASAVAFVITYGEYVHHYPDRKTPVKLAMEAALVAFVFFLLLSLVIGILIQNLVNPQAL